jgi:hypothetical protein
MAEGGGDPWSASFALFKEKPAKGVEYMQSQMLIGKDSVDIANVLLEKNRPGQLDKKMIGDFIGGYKPLNIAVRRAYCGLFDFTGQTFVSAMRGYLNCFRLPGESMLIERIMAGFADRFYSCNPEFFCRLNLTPAKLAELQAAFDGVEGALTRARLLEPLKKVEDSGLAALRTRGWLSVFARGGGGGGTKYSGV